MYSLLPACVSLVFLAYGAYVLGSRGASRVGMSFFLVCVTTFSWQFTWAILFQVSEVQQARVLAKAGYLLILFLPTTLYHFVTELTRRRAEMPGVLSSYALSMVLGVALFASDALVAGVERYFFGFYPVAGRLHPLHVLQTIVVVSRALYMLYAQQRVAVSTERLRLRYCLASLLIYFLAAIDYLCNYGAGFYPPGVIFIAISLGIIAQAIARHNLLVNPMMLAASVAHELRTPLATIRNQARILTKALPELTAAYDYAQRHGGPKGTLWPAHLAYLNELGQHIESEVARSNFIAEMVLASARPDALCAEDFGYHSVRDCVDQALATYPFDASGREKVAFTRHGDFQFLGSDTLLVYVMYNLIKNALAAVDGLPHGRIEIAISAGDTVNRLTVRDTGHGIPEHVLPHVFDPFYTTRKTSGTGMGLAFCKRVLTSFGATIRCRSHEGAFTSMSLEFPVVEAVQAA